MENDFIDFISTAFFSLKSVDSQKIDDAYQLLIDNIDKIVIFGNGGSAAIADHFCCDFMKGISSDTDMPANCISLVSNGPLITALANDLSYDVIFSKQISYHKPKLSIAVSSSGNSKNIVNGLIECKSRNIKTLALVGFDGGEVLRNNLADVILHVNCNNYGIVEDAHMTILHFITQKIKQQNNNSTMPFDVWKSQAFSSRLNTNNQIN